MSLLDRLLGREDRSRREAGYAPSPDAPQQTSSRTQQGPPASDDERAVERYRYLLRTAPPEQVEQAHAEAFATLTPTQRQQVLSDLGSQVPESERARSDDPRALARMATRAEMRQPGTLERSFGGRGFGGLGGAGGMGMGAVVGGSLLASVAGAFVGTAIADAMFDGGDGLDGSGSAEGFEDGAQADLAADQYDDGGGFDGGGDFDV